MVVRRKRMRVLSASESDLVGDHYAFMRTSTMLHHHVERAVNGRFFLEAIGLVYMALSDEILDCVRSLSKYTRQRVNPRSTAGSLLRALEESGIVNLSQLRDTKRFIRVRNDVVHNRWDGTINEFRGICDLGLTLRSKYGTLASDFAEYEMTHGIGFGIGEARDVIVGEKGEVHLREHVTNRLLFRRLQTLSGLTEH